MFAAMSTPQDSESSKGLQHNRFLDTEFSILSTFFVLTDCMLHVHPNTINVHPLGEPI